MTHARQQIRDQIVEDLSGISGTTVYSMRRYAIDHKKLPVVLVYTMGETSSLLTIGRDSKTINRTLSVGIEAIVKSSTDVADVVDTLCAQIEAAIGNDFNLNGLAKSAILTDTQIDINVEGENPISSARLTYDVNYQTATNNAEIAR